MNTTIDEDLTAPAFALDPYPAYRRLLECDAPVYSEARGAWLISHFDQVMGTFGDHARFSSEGRVGAMLDHFTEADWAQLESLREYAGLRGIIHLDPPDHRRLRSLVMQGFKRSTVDQLRPRVHEIVDDLVSRFGDRVDIVSELAAQVPTAVICDMLGVDYADRSSFVAWSDAALALQGAKRPSLQTALAAQDGYVNLQEYFRELVVDRRRHPRGTPDRPDVLTELISAQEDGERLDEADLVQTCLTLLMGGYETTAGLIANSVLHLGLRPALRSHVVDDAGAIDVVMEETLRFESPIQTVTRRVAGDFELAGVQLAEGDLAITMIGAANRDPRRFDEPDDFRIDRARGHIAFGYGVHFCLGASLARMEAPIAVNALLRRAPTFELVDDQPDWHPDKVVTRCPRTLPVELAG